MIALEQKPPIDGPAETRSLRRLATRWQPHLRGHLVAIRVLLTVLLVIAALYTLAITQSLMVPLVLAIFVGFGLNPPVAAASRLGIPRGISALFVTLIAGAVLVGGIWLLAPQAASWIRRAPELVHDIKPRIEEITSKLEQATQATQELMTGDNATTTGTAVEKAAFSAWDVIAVTPDVLAFTLTVALLVFFFLVYGDSLLLRLVETVPSFSQKRHVVDVVRNIQAEISRFLFTATCINFALGALTAAVLWWLDMPDPLLWGGIAALANYVPYLGAVVITAVLAVIGLIEFDQLGSALAPALCFMVLNAIEGNLVTPMILGHRLRLSPVAILIWLLIWFWLWGIAGALLAVPMLTSVKLITERIHGWQWFAHLVSR